MFGLMLVDVVCLAGVVGIALKFLSLLDYWVFFPVFPNVLDSVFLIGASSWLLLRSWRRV